MLFGLYVLRKTAFSEAKLFKLFGVNAELIIDRAWGWEPTTIADIKAYKPSSNSLSVGQVLKCPYNYEKTKLIVREMIDQHVLDLVDKGLVTDQIVLDIGYDIENPTDPKISARYHGDVTTDRYGRKVRAISFYKREGFEIQHSGLDEATGEKDYVMTWQHK